MMKDLDIEDWNMAMELPNRASQGREGLALVRLDAGGLRRWLEEWESWTREMRDRGLREESITRMVVAMHLTTKKSDDQQGT